ncbi:hypothetical protein BDN70DRAFT_874832 [Pholiota conissans]|uniref:Heterokaryon incompatibility domain-containing protein n=1 Tax=Pholiota conissans TaxID=109636 RepID=A0A9P6CW84_9AGAR|nr:hypothetical protein BDN70DRAFT_874832 [Pholiota conissans]
MPVDCSSAHSQALLAALQNFIIPLVRTAVLDPQVDIDESRRMGSEAEEFLVALQRYISSCVQREQPESTRNVKLPMEANAAAKGETDAIRTAEAGQMKEAPSEPVQDEQVDDSSAGDTGSQLESKASLRSAIPQQANNSRLVREALVDLRSKVFNDMPIRLLRFQKRGSELDITLVDRAQVYSLLSQNLEEEVRSSTAISAIDILLKPEKMIKYAILSHTWLHSAPGEVTFEDWQGSNFDRTQVGYQKIVNFCKVAMDDHGLTLGWMDTVCIDKSSSSELDESIRSMYKWYQNSSICITYLSESTALSHMEKDPWFTRGWTLQELLAPRYLKFYNMYWTKLIESPPLNQSDTNVDQSLDLRETDLGVEIIQQKIEVATTLTRLELSYSLSDSIPIYRKMQWAAMRQVTREEDIAYSLMGIFKINMSIAYGEGAKLAFLRLLKEILNTSKANILDVFNWAGDYQSEISELLPYSPRAYLQCSTITYYIPRLTEPLVLSHLGLCIPGLLIPAIPVNQNVQTPTTEYPASAEGDFYATVPLSISEQQNIPLNNFNILDLTEIARFGISKFNLLDKKIREVPPKGRRWAFLILNCEWDEVNIHIPGSCFALLISWSSTVYGLQKALPPTKYKIQTFYPIIFRLFNKTSLTKYGCFSIKRTDLPEHKMQFLSLYL